MSVKQLSLFEIFLIEALVWLGLWLANTYTATLLTSIIVPIVFAVLVIAGISEWIERTKVPRKYFSVMIISIIAPLLVALVWFVLQKM